MMRSFTSAALAAVAAASATMVIASPASAAEHRAFSTEAFQAAQRAGRPILVDVYAGWCPVCRAQAPVIERLGADAANRDLIVFRLDFDKQKAEQRALRVTRQSTLIAYRGNREVGRSVGVTAPARINSLVASTRG